MGDDTQAPISSKLQDLKSKLREIFQLDQKELDFGIYRIMNQKAEEIERFLDDDLLPQVQKTLADTNKSDDDDVGVELTKLEKSLRDAEVDPDTNPKVLKLRAKISEGGNLAALEDEVYSHLYNFFRRYYSEGDFISQRRYKEGVYSIPYEGEEVKLHWANHDQYYIKSTESLHGYAFKTKDGKRVKFELVSASTEQDNKKEQKGSERRFALADPTYNIDGETLTINFGYSNLDKKTKQAEVNKGVVETLKADADLGTWAASLFAAAPTDKSPDRTALEKHLDIFTKKHTFDYFIHKDLGTFLTRELDFYIKNEVMFLDDIENESAPKVESYLSKIKAIRMISKKIIRMLAQLEDFQKKLWLKKKFVLETNYCITLDRVPQSLYQDIIENDQQREEWIKLFAIEEIEGDLARPAYSTPLSIDFLKTNPYLTIDTALFDTDFKDKLLASIGDINAQCDGLLVHGNNAQGLGIIQENQKENIQAIYIDPPYNTDASAIIYKNDYKHSSWMSLMENRLSVALKLMERDGILCMAIDDEEVSEIRAILGNIFPKEIGVAVVRSNPQSRKSKGIFSPVHEYALFYGKSSKAIPGSLGLTDKRKARYPQQDENGRYAWMNMIRTGNNDKRSDRPKLYYPIYVSSDDTIRIPQLEWSNEKNEYKVLDTLESTETAVWPIKVNGDVSIEKNWHRGHVKVASDLSEYRIRRTDAGISIDFKTRLDENSMPVTWWDQGGYASANHGSAELKELFGEIEFDYPKAKKLVEDCVLAAGSGAMDHTVLDFFGGSGTTGHAVINLNREDGGNRKYIMMEMGDHFDNVLKPRLRKVVYSKDWKEGKPVSREGSSHCIKYIRLESYEDALDNLITNRQDTVSDLLGSNDKAREDYMLEYMMDFETRESPSLLNIDKFSDPFNYTLRITRNDEARDATVDLVETFNYLIGLKVTTRARIRDVLAIEGETRTGDKTLILWRNTTDITREGLNDWFKKQEYSTRDQEFDVIYVNGDNNLENLRRDDETWKVRLTEQEFKIRMFDVEVV